MYKLLSAVILSTGLLLLTGCGPTRLGPNQWTVSGSNGFMNLTATGCDSAEQDLAKNALKLCPGGYDETSEKSRDFQKAVQTGVIPKGDHCFLSVNIKCRDTGDSAEIKSEK